MTPRRLIAGLVAASLLVAGVALAANVTKRYRGTHSFDRVNGQIVSIAGTDLTTTAAELNILDGVTATATELNYLDITTLGTGAASKAVVLDAGDDYTWPSAGVLTYGGSTITATGTELSYTDVTTIGTAQASKAAILDASKGISGLGIVEADHFRVANGTQITAAGDLTKAQVQAANYFGVDTTAAAIDVDFANDAALDAADVGSQWIFMVEVGHATQALTVTAGASGVTTVTTLNTLGTTCEDEGDYIQCTARGTAKITCATFCAD